MCGCEFCGLCWYCAYSIMLAGVLSESSLRQSEGGFGVVCRSTDVSSRPLLGGVTISLAAKRENRGQRSRVDGLSISQVLSRGRLAVRQSSMSLNQLLV